MKPPKQARRAHCARKQRFRSQVEAEATARQLQDSRIYAVGTQVNAYHCWHQNHWHIGHRTKEE